MTDVVPPDDFTTFVRAGMPSLLRAAYLLTGDQHLAEDLVQSSLARTYLAWRRLRDVNNAHAYVRRVMYHTQVNRWRRRRVAELLLPQVPEPAGGGRGGDHAGDTALRVSLHRALLALPSRQRAIVVLRYFEDRTEVETAAVLGIAVGTVKSQTARALARLRVIAPELAELTTKGAT